VLHLLGYDDVAGRARQKMKAAEDALVRQLTRQSKLQVGVSGVQRENLTTWRHRYRRISRPPPQVTGRAGTCAAR
jgi:ssRNA-specific RNase YbeY (16S rRNA maturation enzyme)